MMRSCVCLQLSDLGSRWWQSKAGIQSTSTRPSPSRDLTSLTNTGRGIKIPPAGIALGCRVRLTRSATVGMGLVH
jgi:hypothetical protein